jgi:hypothetical protein
MQFRGRLTRALRLWRLIVEWRGMHAEFWIVASGALLSAVFALWALKLILGANERNRPE